MSVAFTTISEANSMPVVWSPSPSIASFRKPRRPQWKSPDGLPKKSRPIPVNTGFPR